MYEECRRNAWISHACRVLSIIILRGLKAFLDQETAKKLAGFRNETLNNFYTDLQKK